MKVFINKKIITKLTITTTVITLISGTFSFWAHMYFKLKINISKEVSIGIIGGSDGPTSIFITGIPSINFITIFLDYCQ